VVITVSSYKGGVGKSTSSIHVAGALGLHRPTLLIDRDRHPGALKWYSKGKDWSFDAIAASEATAEVVRHYKATGNIVVDTPAAPTAEELIEYGSRSDIVLVPTTPDAMALEALVDTVKTLKTRSVEYRVLLVAVPPAPSREGARARASLQRVGVPVLSAEIPRAAAFQHAALSGRLVRDVRGRRSAELWSAYENATLELVKAGGGRTWKASTKS
jgi:chromosome partitioning protein